MTVSPEWLDLLVCPKSGSNLVFREMTGYQELWCADCAVAYPVEDGIPIMLEAQARTLTGQERESLTK